MCSSFYFRVIFTYLLALKCSLDAELVNKTPPIFILACKERTGSFMKTSVSFAIYPIEGFLKENKNDRNCH